MPVTPRCVEVESVSDRSESPRPVPARMSNALILGLAKAGWLPLGRRKAPEIKKPPPAPIPRNAGESGTPGRRGLQRAGWIPKDKPEPKPNVESWRRAVDESCDEKNDSALFRRVREQRLAKEAAAKKNPAAMSAPAMSAPATSAPAPTAPASTTPVSVPALPAPVSAPAPVEWSFAEDYTIKHMQQDGKSWEEISEKLGRPVRAIRLRYLELRQSERTYQPTLETIRARDAEFKAARAARDARDAELKAARTPAPTPRPTSSSSRPSTTTSSLSSPTTASSSHTSFDTPPPARPTFIKAQRRTKPAPSPAAAAPPPPPSHRYLPPPPKSSLCPPQLAPPRTPSRRFKFSVLSTAPPSVLESLTRATNAPRPPRGLSGLNPRPDETEACNQFYAVHGNAPPAYRGLFKIDGNDWTQLACWVLETLQARWFEGGEALVAPLRVFSGQVFTAREVQRKILEVGVRVDL